MVYENNDDMGINIVRKNLWEAVIRNNKIKVKVIKSNEDERQALEGDFLGIKSDTYTENTKIIEININSYNPIRLPLSRRGYDDRGERVFTCYAEYNVDLTNRDRIEFITDYKYGIKKGDIFRIEMADAGLYAGQFCWKEFEIIKIQESHN